MAASVTIRLGTIEEQIDIAAQQIENDPGATAALRAVFDELHRKTREARDELRGADEMEIRDRIIEVEQAADSAKLAAEADERASPGTRRAVLGIHDALSAPKSDLVEGKAQRQRQRTPATPARARSQVR
jgi:hypothetical protein